MKQIVIFAEKPSQAKAYDTKWTRWNLASLPIFPETFEFQVAKGKFQQFKAVQQLFR